jgi:site-specific DNA-methyltransferase (adenine-specific)
MEKLKDIAPLYFQEESSSIFMMDCVSAMKNYPDNYFDLAVVDPPYGIGESGEKNNTRSKLAKSKDYKAFSGNDLNSPNQDYFNELIRVSKNQIIWGANHFIQKIPFNSSCWLVWNKENGDTDFADCELAWGSFKTAVRKFTFKWQGMLQQDMKNKESRIHPTQKPVALYDWIFKNYAETGMKVLDTHLGSGSSRIAAHKAGMDFTGFEIDEDYFRASNKRFKDYHSQLTLFSHVS